MPRDPDQERPDFLIDGWGHFFVRLGFILCSLALLAILLVAMTGVHRLI